MARSRAIRWSVPILFVLQFFLLSVRGSDSPGVMARQLGPQFRTQSSGRFTVISDSDVGSVQDTLKLAESTFGRVEAFAKTITATTRTPGDTMTVVLFDGWSGYEAFARGKGFVVSEAVPGFFDEAANRCYLFNYANAEIIRRKREELSVARKEVFPAPYDANNPERVRRLARIREIEGQLEAHLELVSATVVRHEIAHQVLWNLGLQRADQSQRRWLKEGLAMQFETMDLANRYRLADWRTIDWQAGKMTLRDIVGDAARIGPGAANPQQAYAASWGLVRYLIRKKPKELAAYIRESGSWEKDQADCVRGFEEAFGKIDKAFERVCREDVTTKE
ncbi:MAG: DUF1570 domain-containing protein [Planctomycetota bacterium]